uniref:AAA family ATPase n=1 Tax=Caulobacter sp. S45 TaxID=1641861 RepID=UPI0015752FC9
MRFQRLRLAGFKSFVEATELRIEPGLTGIVGPNGCGKSNLLEALRWVMGASSAKAMRADGMDDVIFGGSTARSSRNHAEVSLQIDNTDRLAPPRFNDAAVIEVVRRISRGAGSSYRVNGVEARARDVQMLFADASTGANSPALVRQGQISELIAAKPANRRRILEEAAGVSGLHSRRHEATLRLDAAEVNLARLDDVAAEIEAGLNRLKREARKAEQYKRLSAEIRTLRSAALYARWSQAASGVASAEQALAETLAATAQTARAASDAEAASASAAEALKPLREEEMVAAAVLQRLDIERERLARETALAEAEVARLKGEIERNGADAGREDQTLADAAGVLDRLGRELIQLDQTLDAAPERTPEFERRVADAAARRAETDTLVERLAGEAAAEVMRSKAAQDRLAQALGVHAKAQARATEADARVERVRSALDQVRAEVAVSSTGQDP